MSRAAATDNVPQMAAEAGNFAAPLLSHRRTLVTEAEGKAWFAIMPPHPVLNVVHVPQAAKSCWDVCGRGASASVFLACAWNASVLASICQFNLWMATGDAPSALLRQE